MSGWRLVDEAGAPEAAVPVCVDGVSLSLPGGCSLLAGLLARGPDDDGVEFFCAIGQCQRCLVRLNGREEVACQVKPASGDVIETAATWGGGRRRPNVARQNRP